MNYRTLSDQELVTRAEYAWRDSEDPLQREVLLRLARSCKHPLSNDPTARPMAENPHGARRC